MFQRVVTDKLPAVISDNFLFRIKNNEQVILASHLLYEFRSLDVDVQASNTRKFMDSRWGLLEVRSPKRYLLEQAFREFFFRNKDAPIILTVPYHQNYGIPDVSTDWIKTINYLTRNCGNICVLPTYETTGDLTGNIQGKRQPVSATKIKSVLAHKDIILVGGIIDRCAKHTLDELELKNVFIVDGLVDSGKCSEASTILVDKAHRWNGNLEDPSGRILDDIRNINPTPKGIIAPILSPNARVKLPKVA